MPCHADRVRRNYHDVEVREVERPAAMETLVVIHISRQAIASCLSPREVEHEVLRRIRCGVESTCP